METPPARRTSSKKTRRVTGAWILRNIMVLVVVTVTIGLPLVYLVRYQYFNIEANADPGLRHAFLAWVYTSGLAVLFYLYNSLKQKEMAQENLNRHKTEAKHEETRIRLFELASLFRVGATLELSWSLGDVLDLVVQRLLTTMKAQHVSVMLYEPRTKTLEAVASYGVEAEFARNASTKIGTGIAGRVAETKEPLLLTSGEEGEDLKREFKLDRNITSSLVVPLLVKDECVGVLNINRIDYPEDFKPHHRQMLGLFGQHLGTIIKRIQSVQLLAERAVNLKSDLEAASSKVGEVDRMRDLFVSSASQELKTPIDSLKRSVEHLESAELNEDRVATILTEIKTSCDKLDALVTDIVDLSRLESGEVVLRVRPSSLNDLARKAVDALRPVAERYEITVSEEYDPELPEIILDDIKLRHPIVQLLATVLRHAPECARVGIRTFREGGFAVLEIKDEGPDPDQPEEEKVFGTFARGLRRSQRRLDGVGVSLNLVKVVVELHGGTVAVSQEQEPHSRYVIRLPIRSDQIHIVSKVA